MMTTVPPADRSLSVVDAETVGSAVDVAVIVTRVPSGAVTGAVYLPVAASMEPAPVTVQLIRARVSLTDVDAGSPATVAANVTLRLTDNSLPEGLIDETA
jgi:hypothetical protein